jgi:Fibronectin type III domain
MSSRAAVVAGAVALSASLFFVTSRSTSAQPTTQPPTAPLLLRYTFQPDCMRKSLQSACDTPKATKRLDLGPQIAVWLEKADGSFVDTLMVTNATAVRGIGNRPGYWKFPSNWHFPYGKRKMVLPVWAHARGKTYNTLIIQDDNGSGVAGELALGFHESVSTPDPYYCLSFRPATWVFEVDAISCPTGMFNSAKGRFDPMQPPSWYPPRNDLTSFGPNDCDIIPRAGNQCPNTSARHFSEVNDLDAVASATPPYGGPFSATWPVPTDLPDGPYVLVVEVNKEFDQNASHMYEAFLDTALPDNALRNNIGQPSVVWKVPFQLDRKTPVQAAVTAMAGYGDWDGETGTLHAPDSTISDTPGSGSGRLMAFSRTAIDGGPPVTGRVHVTTEVPLTPEMCAMLPPGNGVVEGLQVLDVTDKDARVEFTEAHDRGKPVSSYEIRYLVGGSMTLEQFLQATPAPLVDPGMPGAKASVKLMELKPNLTYTVGVRVRGGCVNEGPLAQATFTTKVPMFKQLSGCFVATAAYGSALEPQVMALRRVRDRARDGNRFAAVSVGLYERASPPLADLLRGTEAGRALVRSALSPVVGVIDAAERLARAIK